MNPSIFEKTGPGALVSARGGQSVSAGSVLSRPARAIYIGTSGDLSVKLVDGSSGTFVGVPQGILLPIQIVEVLAGTTASDLVVLY